MAAVIASVLSVDQPESYALVFRLCLLNHIETVDGETLSQISEVIEELVIPKGTPIVEQVHLIDVSPTLPFLQRRDFILIYR